MKAQGFKFVGSTIVYAWMQAVGIVNDHARECYRQPAVARLARAAAKSAAHPPTPRRHKT
jgi:DNA-3-methyladenine glycosylase I